jgi:hypothetical protein
MGLSNGVYQQLPCSFEANTTFQFYLRLKPGSVMVASRKGLFEEEMKQVLLAELTDSDPSTSV